MCSQPLTKAGGFAQLSWPKESLGFRFAHLLLCGSPEPHSVPSPSTGSMCSETCCVRFFEISYPVQLMGASL